MHTLFNITLNDIAIDIKDLDLFAKDKFKYLYDNSLKIGMDYYYIIYPFFSKQNFTIPDYFVDCQYNEIANNYRMRFIILKDSEDYFFVPLRIIDPIDKSKAYRQFILSYKILSLKGCNPKKIYDIMLYFVSHIYTTANTNVKENNIVYFNKMGDLPYNKSKWKSKNGVNILERKIEVRTKNTLSNIELKDVTELNLAWTEIKNKKTSEKIIKDFNRKGIGLFILYYFGSKLVGFQIVTLGYNDMVTCHISKSVTTNIDDIDVHKYIGGFMIYSLHRICFDDLSAYIINYLGVRNLNKYKGLCKFKAKYFKRKVFYYKLPLKDYVLNDYD